MKIALIIALLCSAAALALTIHRELEDPVVIPVSKTPVAEETVPVNGDVADELLRLKLRISALEKAMQDRDLQIEPVPVLQQEVAELSSLQNDLAEYTLNIDPFDVIGVQEREIEDAYNTLLDESKPAGERAKQAALLKKYDLFDEEAIASMTNLFFNANNPGEQGAALAALKGFVPPEVRSGVLETLSTEIASGYENARFRYHGIEALEPFLPDPEVEAMLTVIAQNDPELKIANRAAKSVGLPQRANEKTNKGG